MASTWSVFVGDMFEVVTGAADPDALDAKLLFERVVVKNCHGQIDVRLRSRTMALTNCRPPSPAPKTRTCWASSVASGSTPTGLRIFHERTNKRNPSIATRANGPAMSGTLLGTRIGRATNTGIHRAAVVTATVLARSTISSKDPRMRPMA